MLGSCRGVEVHSGVIQLSVKYRSWEANETVSQEINRYANNLNNKCDRFTAEGIITFSGRSLTLLAFDLTVIGYSKHLAS